MLGHASAAMTLDVYADLFDSDLDAVADRLDTALAAPLPLRRYWPDAVCRGAGNHDAPPPGK
jgi:hypothetical protein